MRRIAFVGNCQLRGLAAIYQAHAGNRRGEQAFYIRAEHARREIERIAGAESVVAQLNGLGDSLGEIVSTVRDKPIFRVPHASGAFLWPQAGGPHATARGLLAPRFGTEYGDRYLDRAIRAGTQPAEAIRKYATVEFAKALQLERRLELTLAMQENRDRATGYDVAGIVRRHFRDESLFRSQGHPQLRIMRHLAETLFRAMQAGNEALDSLAANLTESNVLSEPDFAPIHPAVIRELGLSFVPPETRFAIWDERDTFHEFCHRYLTLDWNLSIEEGLLAKQTGDLARAEELLLTGLSRSPDSARAHAALAEILHTARRMPAAIVHAQEAVRLQPANAGYHSMLSRAAIEAGQFDIAVGAAARAVELDPASDFFLHSLSDLLVAVDRVPEAIMMRQRAASISPLSAQHQRRLADLLHHSGDRERAQAARRRAEALEAARL